MGGYCYHVWPHDDGDLSRWMQWLLTAHVRRYHKHHKSSGHVWQGRFKAFPIQQDGWVNQVETEAELAALRRSVARGAPFGTDRWQKRTAKALALESSLQPRDQPRLDRKSGRIKQNVPFFFPGLKAQVEKFYHCKADNGIEIPWVPPKK